MKKLNDIAFGIANIQTANIYKKIEDLCKAYESIEEYSIHASFEDIMKAKIENLAKREILLMLIPELRESVFKYFEELKEELKKEI